MVVYRTKETLAALATGWLHQHGTKGRAEDKCRYTAQTYGSCQCDTELSVEHTRSTGHEAHGDEHSHEHEGTGDNRHGHIAHGVACCLIGTLVTGIKLGLYGLHHHDGIVHHRTDSQYQGKQSQQVQRETGNGKTSKGTHQRNDNGDGRDECCAEVLQEEVHHQDNQENGDDKCLLYIIDRCVKEVVGRHHINKLQTSGHVLAQLLQFCGNGVVSLLGVCARHLEHHECCGRVAVALTIDCIAVRTEFNICHIAEAKHIAVGQGLQHDVVELLDALQTAGVLQCVLIYILNAIATVASHGSFAQLAGRRLKILLCQCIGDVRRHQLVLRHKFGLQPYTQRVLTAHHHHIAHTLDTL